MKNRYFYPGYVPERYDPEVSYMIMNVDDKEALKYYLEVYING